MLDRVNDKTEIPADDLLLDAYSRSVADRWKW